MRRIPEQVVVDIYVELECRASAGQDIYDSIREAIMLALEEKRTAYIVHNERRFKIVPRDLINEILEQHPEASA